MSDYFDEHQTGHPTGSMRDEEILRASLKEPALFEMLVEKYQEPLLRAAWRVVRNREEAEDIVQEAFVKMYKNADKFEKLNGIELKSWAYKIAINTAITHYRKLKRGEILVEDPGLLQPQGAAGDTGDQRILARSDARAAVGATLARMPDHLRSVLEHYYLGDKSYRSIADEKEISLSTLKMRLFRAKKMFKKLTNGNGK